ncbi:hypothetical protein L1887_30170 [Cichorium endivia]|nr:hypothetical protein L1887_30170 [Cichorium endivia]
MICFRQLRKYNEIYLEFKILKSTSLLFKLIPTPLSRDSVSTAHVFSLPSSFSFVRHQLDYYHHLNCSLNLLSSLRFAVCVLHINKKRPCLLPRRMGFCFTTEPFSTGTNRRLIRDLWYTVFGFWACDLGLIGDLC